MRKKGIAGLLICIFLFGNVLNIYGQETDDMMTDMEKIYRVGFSTYLDEKLNLKAYDDELKADELNFIPCDEEHKTDSQKKDELNLNYIFIRNDVHIDRLTDEQKNILAEQDPDDIYSEEAMDIIEETYADVMAYKKIETEEDKNVKTFYDSQFDPVFVTYDTIVIKIATMPEYNEAGNYVNKEHEYDKEDALTDFAANMEEELNGKLGDIPISVQVEF